MRNVCVIILMTCLSLVFLETKAKACDPHEDCHDQCAFGVCVHDYVCEGRKAACQVPVVGPIITVPGTPLGPGGVLGPGGPGVGPVSGEDLKKCVANPPSCPSVVVGDVAFAAVAPIVDQYLSYLDQQAGDSWKPLPGEIVEKLQAFYPEVDLRGVQYAENINTRHGQNMTVEKRIYFVSKVDFSIVNDCKLLAHELEHSVQYEKRGGRAGFLAEYIAKGATEIVKNGSLDIHDNIDLERDAISKSTEVMAALGWMPLQNGFWRYSGGGAWFGIKANTRTNSDTVNDKGKPTTSQNLPFGPANGSILAPTQWIALQDPGSDRTFFKNGDHPVRASQLKVGDEIYSDRDINVRINAADWRDKVLFILPKGTRVHINDIKALKAGDTTQLWGSVDVDGHIKF